MESPLTCLINQSSVHSSQKQTDSIDFDQTSEPLTIKTEDIDSPIIQQDTKKSQLKVSETDFKAETFDILNCSLKNIKEEQSALTEGESGIESPISSSSLKEEFEQSNITDPTVWSVTSDVPAPLCVVKTSHLPNVPQQKSGGGPVKRGGTGTRNTTAIKKYKCQFCEKAFACGYSLTRHVRIHTGEQCYKCDVCEKIFTTRSSKIRHDRTHLTEGIFKCEFCNKLFKRPSLLTEHQVEHTGQKPFPCGICGKTFAKRFQLTCHLKTHSSHNNTNSSAGESPSLEVCELCGLGFPGKDTLIEHLKEHVAEKALQSDLVDSSNDIENIIGTESAIPSVSNSAVSPYSGLVSISLPSLESPSVQNINQPNTVLVTSPDGSIITDAKIVETETALESKLESNTIYVVGEDGTLQPQISYSLVSPTGEEPVETPVSDFIGNPLSIDTTESVPVEVKLEPSGETSTDIVDSTNSVLYTQSSVPTENPLIVSQAPSENLIASQEQSDNSLVIAQADTTSLDSLKTDDEASESPKPNLLEGQDILALACKEFLEIAPIPEEDISDPSTPITDTESGLTPSSNPANMHYPEKKFHCDYCDKSFTQRNNLASHMRTHTGEKPFKCFHCDEAFSQRWSLTRHVRIHTGEKPFKCQWCDESFRLKGEKTEHEKAQHMNERNERIANAKLNGIGESTPNYAHNTVNIEMIDGTSRRDSKPYISENGMIINSTLSESASQSMLQTDDSDSRSDYDSIQSGHYGDANGDTKQLLLENNQENFSSHMTALLGTNLPHQHINEIKFHYGNEEYMDTSTMVPTSATVLTQLTPAEVMPSPALDEKGLNHHCDFCESSFATRTELVQHFSAHTG